MTLLELMLALAILSILLTLAYPVYDGQIQRARRADAQTALHLIALAQEQYYTAHGSYTMDLTLLNIPTSFQAGFSENGYYSLVMVDLGDDQQFQATASAISKQNKDTACQVFSLNQLGVKSAQTQNAVTNPDCW